MKSLVLWSAMMAMSCGGLARASETCKCGPVCDCGPKCKCGDDATFKIKPIGPPKIDDATIWSYGEGCELAKKTNVPLVTFVGGGQSRANPGTGRITAYAASLPGFPDRCVIVSIWIGGTHYGRAIDAGLTPAAIDAATVDKAAKSIRDTVTGPAPINCPGGNCPGRR